MVLQNCQRKDREEKIRKEKASQKYIPEVNPRIKQIEIYLGSAGESILKGNDDQKKLCLGKYLNGKANQQVQVLIDM